MELRRVTRADAPLFEAELCDPVMMEHLGGAISVEDAHATLERQLDPETTWSFVIVTDEGEDAGSVALWTRDDGVSEIGWMVLPGYQRRGLGKGAVATILERAGADGRWGPIHAYPTVTNIASNAMCRSLGFQLLETIDGEYSGRPLRFHHWCWDPGGSAA